jgi:hypothetical protein
MEIPKNTVLELLEQLGQYDQLEPARQELPDPVEPDRDAGLLSKFGIDAQVLLGEFGGGIAGR